MKELTNYIVEKYKLTKNTMNRSIHVKGDFYPRSTYIGKEFENTWSKMLLFLLSL